MNAVISLRARRITIVPLLTAAGTVIFIFESLIPQPLPWAKLGLSNIAVLLTLYYFNFVEALAVSWLRVIIGGLFTGSLFSPSFAFGFVGGACAVSMMWMGKRFFQKKFSPVGLSIMGAAAHNIGQLTIAQTLFVQQTVIWKLLPIMLTFSVFSGALTGLIAFEVLEKIRADTKLNMVEAK
jgi:heptaprenyl diphosphate synthase